MQYLATLITLLLYGHMESDTAIPTAAWQKPVTCSDCEHRSCIETGALKRKTPESEGRISLHLSHHVDVTE